MNWYKIARKVTPEIEDKIIQCYKPKDQGGRGWTTMMIGERFHLSDSTVLAALIRRGIPIRGSTGTPRNNRQYFVGEREEKEIVRMYTKDLLSTGKIGKNMGGLPRWKILQVLKKYNVPIRDRGIDEELEDKVLELSSKGLNENSIVNSILSDQKLVTRLAIERHKRIDKSTIRRILQKHGLYQSKPRQDINDMPIIKQNKFIVYLYNMGYSPVEIAAGLETSVYIIDRILNMQGVQKRPKGRRSQNLMKSLPPLELDKMREQMNQQTAIATPPGMP